MIRVLLAVALLVLVSCLPKGSLGRADEVTADRYRVSLQVEVRTTGLALDPFTWNLEGTLLSSYTRTFRDGSMGRLVRFEGLVCGAGRCPLEGAWLELRAFPDGPVLDVGPLARWAGRAGGLESLDFLWPALSPTIPPLRSGRAEAIDASWPVALRGGPWVRTRAQTEWRLDGRDAGVGDLSYTGTFTTVGGWVSGSGEAVGRVRMDRSAARVAEHRFTWRRETTTVWPSGSTVVQHQEITGELVLDGDAPAPPLDTPPIADDAGEDATPLRISGVGAAPDPAVDVHDSLPFLLLPHDAGAGVVALVREQLFGADRMPGVENAR